MEKKYRSKLKPDTKKVGQLAYEKHWSVVGLYHYQMYRLFYSKSIGIRITMNIF